MPRFASKGCEVVVVLAKRHAFLHGQAPHVDLEGVELVGTGGGERLGDLGGVLALAVDLESQLTGEATAVDAHLDVTHAGVENLEALEVIDLVSHDLIHDLGGLGALH